MSVLVSILLKVTVTATLALVAARLARRSRASVRHVLLVAAFAMLAVLPIASLVAPSVNVVVPDAVQGAIESFDAVPLNPRPAAAPAAVQIAVASSDPRSWWPSLGAMLIGGWVAGAAIFLVPIFMGLREVRFLRRTARPWTEGQSLVDALARGLRSRRPVDAVLHDAVPGPMTCGWRRPAIVLPMDARTWPAEDLQRAIVHELEHVRRGDWMSQCLSRVIVAMYWFHPIVWAVWRQLALEAERACDDAVVGRSEATAYADQLVVLAQRLAAAPNQPQLAMANRRDLATRVRAVLDRSQRRGRAGTWWVVAASAASALIVTMMSPLRIVASVQIESPQIASPQTADAAQKFEVVSIKPCTTGEVLPPAGGGGRSGGYGGGRFETSPDTLTINCMTVEGMVFLGYAAAGKPLANNVRSADVLPVKGGPEWAHSERWSIEAKAAAPTERRTMLRSMLPALLEDRFRLQQHRETEERPMYAMVVAKDGLKITPMKPGDCLEVRPDASIAAKGMPEPGTFWCGALVQLGSNARRIVSMGGTTLARFADAISGYTGRYVLDKTGVSDVFNITITFAPVDAPPIDAGPGVESIFTVLEKQLGLKLEPTRGPAEYHRARPRRAAQT